MKSRRLNQRGEAFDKEENPRLLFAQIKAFAQSLQGCANKLSRSFLSVTQTRP